MNTIPDAYDIKKARLECNAKGLQSRVAIAWMESGALQLSLSPKEFKAQIAQGERTQNTSPNHVRCVAFSRGEQFSAWKDDLVRKMLLNPPGTRKAEQWDFIPIEDTIFDRDLHTSAWHPGSTQTLEQRCQAFAMGVLTERDKLDRLANEVIADYGDLSAKKSDTIREIAWRLEEIGNAVERLRIEIGFFTIGSSPDAGVALRQGLRIGMWLAEVRALIATSGSARLAAQAGVSSRKRDPFWAWILSDPRFDGKRAVEIWAMLDGTPDPDPKQKGYPMRIGEKGEERRAKGILHYGNFLKMQFQTFSVNLSRKRREAKKRSRRD